MKSIKREENEQGNRRDRAQERMTIWPGREPILEKVNHLYQEIFMAPSQPQDPLEALLRAYGKLSEEEKIAFLLAGGAEQLVDYRRHLCHWGPTTGSLVLST